MLGRSLLRQTYLIGVFFRTCKHPVNYKCKSTHSQGKLAVLFEVWCNEYDPERPVWLKDPWVWRVIRRQNTVRHFTVRQDLTALEISNFYRLLQKLPAQEHFKYLVHVTSAYVICQAYLRECFWLANGVQTFCNALCCAKPPQQYQNEISCNYILGTTSSFMLDWAEETPQIIQTAVGFIFFILLCLCQNCVSRFRCRKAGRSIT